MNTFHKHVFFCAHQRTDGSDCCGNHGAQKLRDYAKDRVKALGLSTEKNRIRINAAGCMDNCDEAPVLVVYPEGVWYTYRSESDIDEIIEEHLKNGRVVERLKI